MRSKLAAVILALFFAGLVGYSFFSLFEGLFALGLQTVFALIGLVGAGLGGYYMYKLYRIPARPFWNHWHTGASFAGTALSLGPLLVGLAALVFGALSEALAQTLLLVIGVGLALEGVGLLAHARDLIPGPRHLRRAVLPLPNDRGEQIPVPDPLPQAYG